MNEIRIKFTRIKNAEKAATDYVCIDFILISTFCFITYNNKYCFKSEFVLTKADSITFVSTEECFIFTRRQLLLLLFLFLFLYSCCTKYLECYYFYIANLICVVRIYHYIFGKLFSQ